MRRILTGSFILIVLGILIGCTRAAPNSPPLIVPQGIPSSAASGFSPSPFPTPTISYLSYLPPTRMPGSPILIPTPDAPHAVPTLPSVPPEYIVQPGDTLGKIAFRYSMRPETIAQANGLADMNTLEVGQVLKIPLSEAGTGPSEFKIIPDSELVFGPYSITLQLDDFVSKSNGYLAGYTEQVNGESLTGTQIISKVAEEYSVNPRLLLALLEHQSGWVTNPNIEQAEKDYPMGLADPGHAGLYKQLAWSANQLNRGFYGWQVDAFPQWALADGSLVAASPVINAGTAGLQYFFAQLDDNQTWKTDVGLDGLFATYVKLFGYPFDNAIEPLLPPGLTQPAMQLPFLKGASWSFTGGPHGGWDTGSAWAALDFAPPGDSIGCLTSDAWVTAVADGPIVRAEDGAVVQDLDGDGYEQTGWTVLYMHMAQEGRVQPGTYLHTGDRIGHPSCEGGYATAAHLHLARRYHGMWISADGSLPFNLDGWVSSGTGVEYDGALTRNGVTILSWDGNIPENQVSGGN